MAAERPRPMPRRLPAVEKEDSPPQTDMVIDLDTAAGPPPADEGVNTADQEPPHPPSERRQVDEEWLLPRVRNTNSPNADAIFQRPPGTREEWLAWIDEAEQDLSDALGLVDTARTRLQFLHRWMMENL